MGLLTKLFGTRSEREIKKIQPLVDKILSLEEEYKALLKDKNMVVSALCGDMGGFGFEREEDNKERIEKTKRIILEDNNE